MRLRALKIRGWRNLTAVELRPGARATVLFGANGQGKTNVVEAIHYLLTFRSFRSKRAEDLVRWGAPGARLDAEIESGGLERRLAADLSRERKTFSLDGKPVRRDNAALRALGVVLFVPEDLLLPRAAPSERRRFLDVAAFGLDRTYYHEAYAYQRVLKSRNALLKRGPGDPVLLDAYDEELAAAGARIVLRRRAVVAAVAPRFQALFARIHEPRSVGLRYVGHEELAGASDRAQVESALRRGLAARRGLDARRGFTGFGPHTDDLAIDLDGRPAREHASQGQTRSVVLALKLAELENLTARLEDPPLLLLDDVASELDELRRGRLFETIAALPGQSLITVSDRELLPQLPERVDFEVSTGDLRAV
jgi:DNA replication and repair protein RecF